MYAVAHPGFGDVVQEMINKKANVTHRNRKQETPLDRAADEQIKTIILEALKQ